MVSEKTRCPRCGRSGCATEADCPACLKSPPPGDSLARLSGLDTRLRAALAPRGYVLGEGIGAGGTAAVYKARQVALDRSAAVKVLSPEYLSSPSVVFRFEREARVLAALNHPNLVHLYEFGRERDLLFLILEYVDGVTLQQWLQGPSRRRASEFLDLIVGVCDGLEAIHKAGLVHRDLKPSNILIPRDGGPKLSDFGQVLDAGEAGPDATSEPVTGTPHYMSPEQVLGKPADRRSDLYSLGVLLFQGLTGRLPFEGPSTLVLIRHAQEPAPSLVERAPGLPGDLYRLIAELLSKDPAARPASAAEVRDRILKARATCGESTTITLPGETVSTLRGESVPVSGPAPSRPRPMLRRLAVGLLLIAAAATFGLLRPRGPQPATTGKSGEDGAGLRFESYEGTWSALPFFDRLTPTSTGVVPGFGAPPGLGRAGAGLRLRGWLQIPKEGSYAFTIKGGADATLAVQGKPVLHSGRMAGGVNGPGVIHLPAGPAFLSAEVLVRPESALLEAYWQGPDLAPQRIPPSLFRAEPPDPVAVAAPAAPVDPVPEGNGGLEPGLTFEYFEGRWDALPDFQTLVPTSSGVSRGFDLGGRRRESDYAFRFRGLIRAPRNGEYLFTLLSDDGSRLRIGDREVVSNDGAHAPHEQTGRIELKAGLYPLTVDFFQVGGGAELEVSWKGPGFSRRPIPAELLFHRPDRSASASSPPSAAGDWPQWRGPNRDNVSTETGLLRSWPVNGPPLSWKADGLGISLGTVAVAAGRIYLMGDRDGGTYLFALEASDGKTVWRARLGDIGAARDYPGPRSTPATDGESVYALSTDGTLTAARASDGKVIWTRTLTSLGGSVPKWGYAESPLLDGELLLCTPGGPRGTVAALDKRTGGLVWQSAGLSDSAQYGSLVPAFIGDVRQYVVLAAGAVAGIDARSGKVLWQTDWSPEFAVSVTPVVRGDLVFVILGDKNRCRCLRIRSDGSRFRAEEQYANELMDNHHGGVVGVGDFLYSLDTNGLQCVNLRSGDLVWKAPSIGRGALIVADGLLIGWSEMADRAAVALADASPEGYRERGRFRPPAGSGKALFSHPVVAGRKLYLRDQELLFCYDLRDSR